MDNPGIEEFFVEAPFTLEWTAYWPYPEHVVLGGTKSAEDASTAGRLVVPKAVREELCLSAGTEVELRVVDRHLEIGVPPTQMRLEQSDHGVVAAADRDMPPLTTELVRETLERVRR